MSESQEAISVRRLLGAGLAARILLDTGVQMFFPFLPLFAQGLGITAVAMGRLVSVRSATGLLAPLASPLAARRGYRFVLQAGLSAAALGYLLLGLDGGTWLAIAGMVLAGVGTFTFVPMLQAYLSARLPYNRRARGLGLLELAWALAGIVGLFLVGELIARTSWRAPLLALSGALVITAVYYRTFPALDAPARNRSHERTPFSHHLRLFADLGANRRSAWSTLLGAGLIMFAGMNIFISYGSWLVDAFALGPAQLGRVALVLGIGDLLGATLVTLLGDRLGKRISVLLAIGVAALGFLLLPFAGALTITAVGGLFLTRISFEAGFVSVIPLLSEQVPEQRSKLMGLGTTFALLGSTLAGLTGPWTYAQVGITGPAAIALTAILFAGLLIWSQVKETVPSSLPSDSFEPD